MSRSLSPWSGLGKALFPTSLIQHQHDLRKKTLSLLKVSLIWPFGLSKLPY